MPRRVQQPFQIPQDGLLILRQRDHPAVAALLFPLHLIIDQPIEEAWLQPLVRCGLSNGHCCSSRSRVIARYHSGATEPAEISAESPAASGWANLITKVSRSGYSPASVANKRCPAPANRSSPRFCQSVRRASRIPLSEDASLPAYRTGIRPEVSPP